MDANAKCAKLSADCARLSKLNQVTVCTVMYAMFMFAHLLVENVHIHLQENDHLVLMLYCKLKDFLGIKICAGRIVSKMFRESNCLHHISFK